jgi:hypothetical protein
MSEKACVKLPLHNQRKRLPKMPLHNFSEDSAELSLFLTPQIQQSPKR